MRLVRNRRDVEEVSQPKLGIIEDIDRMVVILGTVTLEQSSRRGGAGGIPRLFAVEGL
jgi:hypothetical protein